MAITFEKFEANYLVENFTDKKGRPKHTRYVKRLFYKFNEILKKKYNFDLYTCSVCGLREWQNKPIVIELDHLNEITNDSRIQNLSPKCPNCHSQTSNFRNRKSKLV